MPNQRNIRKLPRRRSNAFDERNSTTQWVLMLWAMLITVLVLALGGWEDPRMLYNAWVRLMGVAVTWALLAWLAAKPGKWMEQRLRFGVAWSLVFHTVLAIVLLLSNLMFFFTEPVTDIDRQVVMQPEEKLPEVVEIVRPETEQQEYEKPVPTEQLAQQIEAQTEQSKAESPTESVEQQEAPELASTDAPQSMNQRRPRTALAHRAESPGQQSRQTEAATLATTAPQPIVRPKQPTPSESAEPSPAAQVAKANPSQSESTPAPEQASAAAPTNAPRRENTDAPQVAQNEPTPRQRQSPAEVVEPALASIAPSVTTPETNRVAAEPSRLERPREPVVSQKDTPEPQIERPTPPTMVARRDTREPEMTPAAAPTPLDRRTAVSVAQAVELTPTARRPAEQTRSASTTDQAVEPIAAAVAKQQQPNRQQSNIAEAVEDSSTATPSPSVKSDRRPTRVAMTNPAATPANNASPSKSIAQAIADSPESVMAAVPQQTTPTPSTSPSPRVLADSRGGTGMQGSGLNNVGDAPAPASRSAPFASSTAKRNRSTQTERGPSLAPNPVAQVAKGRAAAATPQSTLAAIPTPMADVAGATKPDNISASSSAATDRQFANVTLGDITAAKGEAEFDTGPPQVAPEQGQGRGSMGGRMAMQAPETNRGLGPRRIAQAAMSPSSVSLAPPASGSAGAAAPSTAAIARVETQSGGALQPSAAGRPDRADASKLTQARAPAGATSGGGAISPSTGPEASSSVQGATPPRAGGSIARTRSANGRGAGPSVALPSPSGGSVAGAGPRGSSAAAIVSTAEPTPMSPAATGKGTSQAVAAAPATDSMRDVAPKRPAMLIADLGDGGLAAAPTLDAGIPQRVARRQASPLRMTPSRFDNETEGGDRSPPGRKRNPAPAFAARSERRSAAPITSPTDPRPKTEAAIELGLEFLARVQREDGSWSLGEFAGLPVDDDELPSIRADGAATGLALLAFLGGGYDHYDDKYRTVIQRGLDYLVSQQSDRGDIFPERDLPGPRATRFYSHGIATLALCEAYGMTGDPELERPAQLALNYIIETQHPRYNGWRYTEGTNSDLSVTGWQMMAMRSGELAGLSVNQPTYRRVGQFVEKCRATAGGGAMYCYNPYVTSTRDGMKHYNKPSTVMTAVGMLMKLYLGENRDSQLMQRGAEHLLENLPTHDGEFRLVPVGTARNPQRDTYYWYYATQVMFHMGGENWQQWHEHLHPLLVDHQTQEGPLAGSWNPQKPIPDMWGAHGGRLYVTCLNLLSLEVSYRHLPLYEMTGK
ncbi:hypothetical protein [Aeoliella mucimassa]|uniref:Prenyltransferase and squalene oxidase repeat protein n=1 Tax=Aeoliella mucimassa TaxID=2527972 RepID=A0A518AMM7_9BACT|nr:hypothetical protein [Aeoliella mucimassa]QDU55984.1 hypothetical protein Pan181_21860 [Aeoliella mucimassa]